MSHTFILTVLLKFFVAAGFAYIIWILALKESAILKVIGQIIAIAILILVIVFSVLPMRTHKHMSFCHAGRLVFIYQTCRQEDLPRNCLQLSQR